MKIIKLSDLHLESAKYKLKINNDICDVVIFAGDIGNKFQAMKIIEELLEKNIIVIYILGNHEYYNYNTKTKTINEIKKGWIERSNKNLNLHVLDNSSVVIDGVKFIGSTAWTKINTENYSEEEITKGLSKSSDFSHIITSNLKKEFKIIRSYPINIEEYNKLHEESIQYLKKEITKPFNGKKILITHQPLLRESFDDDFNINSFESQLFYSNYPELIEDSDIDYYFHGHIHKSFNYKKNNTNVICNPYGYAKYNEINKDFKPYFLININNTLVIKK